MSKWTLLYIFIGWCILTLIKYYLLPFFIVNLLWLGLSIALFIISVIQLFKLIKERKSLSKLRIIKFAVFSTLFYLTFNPLPVNGLIEKIDWKVFYNKRLAIVGQIKENEQKGIFKLPFKFPVISNGGNEVLINRNKDNNKITVTFWVYRNFFSAPSTCFVYTNDNIKILELEKLISYRPERNWKIQDNWYRTFRE